MNKPCDVAATTLITAEDVRRARRTAAAKGRSILAELEDALGLAPRVVLDAAGALFGYAITDTGEMLSWQPAFDVLPLARAMQKHCGLFHSPEGNLLAVIPDPFDPDIAPWIEAQARSQVSYRLALAADIHAYLARQEESTRAMDAALFASYTKPDEASDTEELSYQAIAEDASPIIKIVNSTLYDALKAGASDIHLESTSAGFEVKYRIDGVLDRIGSVAGLEVGEQVISRIKVLAELDIAERRVPQDGRFSVSSRGRDIDIRVSIMPSIHGEDAVLRILDKRALMEQTGALRLDALGFDGSSLVTMRNLAAEPYGMLLVTGPTGSGKTTTLYAAISEINTGRDKIITIEDPVEYELPGVLQIPVNEKKGLTFARGLRSILRHDPDKILVGEIRDPETAEIAVQSALTGHLVLTTVHALGAHQI